MGTVVWITLLEENIGWWCNVMLKSLRSYQVPSWPTWVSTKVPGCWRLPPSCHLVSNSFFFLRFVFWCGPFLKSSLNLLQYCFHFTFLFFFLFFFGLWGMWDLSSLTRNRTHTPCIGRWNLNHWTTRELPHTPFDSSSPTFLHSSVITQDVLALEFSE